MTLPGPRPLLDVPRPLHTRLRYRPAPAEARANWKPREAKDILLKYIADGLRGAFPAALGLDLPPIVEPLPAELPTLEVRAEQPDRFYRLADATIVHLEFQTTVTDDDLPRFYHSQFAAGEYYRTQVHTVVIYGAGITSAPAVLDRGSGCTRCGRCSWAPRRGKMW